MNQMPMNYITIHKRDFTKSKMKDIMKSYLYDYLRDKNTFVFDIHNTLMSDDWYNNTMIDFIREYHGKVNIVLLSYDGSEDRISKNNSKLDDHDGVFKKIPKIFIKKRKKHYVIWFISKMLYDKFKNTRDIVFFDDNPRNVEDANKIMDRLRRFKVYQYEKDMKGLDILLKNHAFSFGLEYHRVEDIYCGVSRGNYKKLKFTEESLYSVSGIAGAKELYKIITKYVPETSTLTVTDGTANVGSDSVYMAQKFKLVNSIELSKDTYEVLKSNINVLGIKNINLISGDTTEVLKTLKQDIIFVDAPWGGTDYKKHDKMKLYMSGKEISELYLENKDHCKLFVFKVPCNYDVEYFKGIIKDKVDVYDYVKKDRCYYKFLAMYSS